MKMAGTVKHSKLDNPTARAKLKRGRQPHWQTLITGRAHLGYQRQPDAKAGRWVLRRFNGEAYSVEALGSADDDKAIAADGIGILTFEQAKLKALDALDASAIGKPHGRLTVRKAIAGYLEFLKAEGRPTADTEWRANAHILPKLGAIEVAALASDKIRKWHAALANAPALLRTREGGKQKFKAPPGDDAEAVRRRRSSANRVLTILKAALNRAYDDELITSNAAWSRRVKPYRGVDSARVRFLAVAEAKRLLNACAPDFRPLVMAALATGSRYGELVRLEVCDFDADSGTVNIRKSKSGKPRHVILTEEGSSFFGQTCAGRAGTELMFRRADGTPWKTSHQSRPMKEASINAKLMPPVTFHVLRHSYASLCVMARVPLLVISKNLGHADTSMVIKHYGHMSAGHEANAIRAGAPRFGWEPDKKLATLPR
jgi:integrase